MSRRPCGPRRTNRPARPDRLAPSGAGLLVFICSLVNTCSPPCHLLQAYAVVWSWWLEKKFDYGIDLNARRGILVSDMNNYSFLQTTLDTPTAQDMARYTRADGTTDHFGQACFEAGWYRAQGEGLARTIKILKDVLAEKDRQIERLNTRPIG